MSFLRNFRNNLIQHQSNKVFYKDAERKRSVQGSNQLDESDEERRSSSRFDTYTRKSRTKVNYDNDRTSNASNYSTLRSDNVVRVYLNSPASPTSTSKRYHDVDEKSNSKVNRNDTFTKSDRPSTIVRSDTFTLKSESQSPEKSKKKDDEYEKQQSNYSTFTRSNRDRESKSRSSDKSNNNTVDSGTYRKSDKNRGKLTINTNTFTKPSKPKRVESLIKRFDKILRREPKEQQVKEVKEPSPAPSSESVESLKNKKNLFNLMGGHKPRTRDVGILCKIDDDLDYQKILSTRKITLKSDRPLKSARKLYSDSVDSRRESTVKAAERKASKRMEESEQPMYENVRKSSTNSTSRPMRVEIDLRRASKYDSDGNESNNKPIGIANPQIHHRPSVTSVTSVESSRKLSSQKYQVSQPIRIELEKPSPAPRSSYLDSDNFANRRAPEKMSFREYRESLRSTKGGSKSAVDPEHDLKKSHQQSFFVPF